MGKTKALGRLISCIVALSLCCGALCHPAVAGEGSESLDSTYKRQLASHQGLVITATHGSQTLKALTIFSSSPTGIVNRFLLAGGDAIPPLVFTNTLNPRTGAKTSRIEDDQTGWWLEAIEQIMPPVEDLATFMHEGREMPPGTATPVVMRAKSGVIYETVVLSPGTEAELEPVWAEARKAEGVCESLRSSVPKHVQNAVATLRSLASLFDELVHWRFEIGVLDACLRPRDHAVAAQKQEWTVERQEFNVGLSLSSPDMIELASKFQSFENAEPLTYQEIAELLGGPEAAVR
jgi:hypothetical protein